MRASLSVLAVLVAAVAVAAAIDVPGQNITKATSSLRGSAEPPAQIGAEASPTHGVPSALVAASQLGATLPSPIYSAAAGPVKASATADTAATAASAVVATAGMDPAMTLVESGAPHTGVPGPAAFPAPGTELAATAVNPASSAKTAAVATMAVAAEPAGSTAALPAAFGDSLQTRSPVKSAPTAALAEAVTAAMVAGAAISPTAAAGPAAAPIASIPSVGASGLISPSLRTENITSEAATNIMGTVQNSSVLAFTPTVSSNAVNLETMAIASQVDGQNATFNPQPIISPSSRGREKVRHAGCLFQNTTYRCVR